MSGWSVRSWQIRKWLVFVFESLNLNVIIPHRCLLHSLHCADECSYQAFMGFAFFHFYNIFGQRKRKRESFSSCFFFSPTFLTVQSQHSKHSLFSSNCCSPSTPIKQALFIELWGAKSLTHSVTHINLPPRCPLCLSPCSPNAISLSKPDEKTYDHLNKHRHSMASLSARLRGKVSFMWCMCVPGCVQMFMLLYVQT